MSKLKNVIFSIEDVVLPQGKASSQIFKEVSNLIAFLRKRNIEFAVFTNRRWTLGSSGEKLYEALKRQWGDFPYFCTSADPKMPGKPKRASTEYLLSKMGWRKRDTIYVGASDSDMQTAVNAGLLFLRATWWANKTDYGFEFDSPKDIARYIDTFCLRDHLWCHEIHDGNFEFYALAPFSTMKPEYTLYSEDARAAAKQGLGHPDFWVGALVSSLYFSGVHERINHIATYPGHKSGSGNAIMDDAIAVFGKCFRKSYLSDLILRHTTAVKSQHARRSGVTLDHRNQLNTIKLNPTPMRTSNARYKKSPLSPGKTILVLDDICTRGYSLEAARKYIEQTGSKVISVSWLKTINTDIEVLGHLPEFNPYESNSFEMAPVSKTHGYRTNIVDNLAPAELTAAFSNYENWDWP